VKAPLWEGEAGHRCRRPEHAGILREAPGPSAGSFQGEPGSELTWILDPTNGNLFVEGLTDNEAVMLVTDLLPPARSIDCARPLTTAALPRPGRVDGQSLQVARIYHGSAVEGPGRRSVLQVQGCPIQCQGCSVSWTHDPSGGVTLNVDQIVEELLNPVGEPRDGITILGGEPMAQPLGLVALLRALKNRGLHVVVYSGYTLEALIRRPAVHEALLLTDLLVDGPFVASLADGAGEWRGSRNQRIISNPGQFLQENAWRCL